MKKLPQDFPQANLQPIGLRFSIGKSFGSFLTKLSHMDPCLGDCYTSPTYVLLHCLYNIGCNCQLIILVTAYNYSILQPVKLCPSDYVTGHDGMLRDKSDVADICSDQSSTGKLLFLHGLVLYVIIVTHRCIVMSSLSPS